MKPTLSCLLALLLTAPAPSQTPAARPAPLDVDNIMRGPELYGHAPRAVRWSGDGQRIYFEWKLASDPLEKDYDTWVANRDGSGLRKLSKEEARQAPPERGAESLDRRLVAFSEDGDIYLYDRAAGQRRRLTNTSDAETAPQLTRDGKRVTFQRGGNLYALSLDGGALEQLTDIRSGGQGAAADGGEKKATESQEALKKQERALLDTIERRATQREAREAERKQLNPRKPWNLDPRQSVMNLALSPDESYIVATVMERASGARSTIVPNYVTESAYTETIPSRTLVGDHQNRTRTAILQVRTGDYKWIDHSQKVVQGGKEVERPVYLQNQQWSEDGAKLVMQGRSADFKDRWVFAIDPATAQARVLFHLHDDAWVGGPGGFTLGFMPGGKAVYFQAERDGWSHLYAVDWEGGEPRALTSGKWEVESAVLSPDKRTFLLTTSEASPFERHLYAMPAEGGARTRLTTEPGDYQAVPAPGGQALAVIHSSTNRPPELYVMENRPGAPLTRITTSPSPEFLARAWLDVPIVEIPARDGARVPAHIYKPAHWKKGGPAVVFVHGAGYLQNVHRWWSSYSREYLFHHLLMERGYLVLDIDYRGSAGYGRDWRTAIYRHMGGKDLDDHVDAARWLVREHGVDPKRIGIYGGSYGGFITLMAMFTQPGVFAAGAALRPVTDWDHYNHPYTASILNLPQQDHDAYARSSPIYHAAGLQGALLICHGMVDVNVHFQDTVQLVQKLIELRKENWQVAIYPVEDHGFVQPASWADEYKRILQLFETNLRK
jgi:dipeptidyl aminopeptidase/acylaminoacyl peptidase